MAITVDAVNLEQVEKKLNGMKQKAPKVLKLAVNDTARKARSRLAKEAQKTYAVKVGGFNRAMKIKLATNGNPVAIIRSTGKKIPLGKFAYRRGTLGPEKYFNPTLHRTQVGKGGRGASAKQLKSSSFKSDNGAKLKWFVAQMSSGHTGIFKRNAGVSRGKGNKNYAILKKMGVGSEISEIMGPSVPEMLGNEKRVYGIVEPYIMSDLKQAVNRHVARAIKGDI